MASKHSLQSAAADSIIFMHPGPGSILILDFSLQCMCALIVTMHPIRSPPIVFAAICSMYLVPSIVQENTTAPPYYASICCWIIGLYCDCESYGYVITQGLQLMYCIVVFNVSSISDYIVISRAHGNLLSFLSCSPLV